MRLDVYPYWQSQPHRVEIEVEPESLLHASLSAEFGIQGRALTAVDSQGKETRLDLRMRDLDASIRLAVSTRPLVRPAALFGADGASSGHPEGHEEVTQAPARWRRLGEQRPLLEAEAALARALDPLGFGLDVQDLDLEARSREFPELPKGTGVHSSSPYRLVLACAVVLEETALDDFEALEVQVEQAAEVLWQRLRLSEPDALDLRLHLFYPATTLGRRLARSVLETGEGEPVDAQRGQVRRGWRRVLLHPYRDDDDRIRQSANLARWLLLERLDRRLRRHIQARAAERADLYLEAGRCLDFQACAWVRSADDQLTLTAEEILLQRLRRVLTDRDQASSGRSVDLAHGLLRRCGFFERQGSNDGERLGEVIGRLSTHLDEAAGEAGEPTVPDLHSADTDELRNWLQELSPQDPPALWPAPAVARLCRTVVVDAACRLRQQAESLFEREVVPAEGRLDLSFVQFADAIDTLAHQVAPLQAKLPDDPPAGSLAAWLHERQQQLEKRLEHELQILKQEGDSLGLWWRRLPGLKRAPQVREALLAALRRARETWLEVCLLRHLAGGGGAPLAALAEDLNQRLHGFGLRVDALHEEGQRERQRRDEIARLGAGAADTPLPAVLLETLKQRIYALPLDDAVRAAFRHDGVVRDLLHLQPEAVLQDLQQALTDPLDRTVATLARDAGLRDWQAHLAAAVEDLFTGSGLQHDGSSRRLAALRHATTVFLVTSPRLARHVGGEAVLREALHHSLEAQGLRDLDLDVRVCRAAPGLLLCRWVHGLSLEDFALCSETNEPAA